MTKFQIFIIAIIGINYFLLIGLYKLMTKLHKQFKVILEILSEIGEK